MGILADAAIVAGGAVIGVMPQSLVEREIQHNNLTELHVVATMHERKTKMAELADEFIALPGGAGALEEIFEQVDLGSTRHSSQGMRRPQHKRVVRPASDHDRPHGRRRVSATGARLDAGV
jgi:uncharacterized protein (TIGR00730 family)